MRQPGLRWLLATALWLGTAAAASASSGGSSGGSSGVSGSSSDGGCPLSDPEKWCRHEPYQALRNELDMEPASRGSRYLNKAILACCDKLCPNWKAEDFLQTCQAHTYHSAYTEWQEEAHHHSALQWNVFFVAFCLLLGAFFKQFLPTQVPYTVGLLLVFMLFGLLGQGLSDMIDCPSHAWKYAVSHDDHGHTVEGVTEDGWKLFIGDGFNKDSFCIKGEKGDGSQPRSCGNGDADPPGCYRFEDLNRPFKVSNMLVESVANTEKTMLSADELWTPKCNLVRDVLGLANIDPHVMLVIFLPALLFESAAFGIDMGLFLKQKFQILTMAFPAMVFASAITGGLINACFPHWEFFPCWLIGIIQSATDPVAVVALLKELGAAQSLGTLIEGESLLNDGSAVVLFIWVRNVIGYTVSSDPPAWMQSGELSGYFAELFRVLAQMLFFGVVFGLACGKFTVFACRFLYNQLTIEGPVVLAMSYLCFWLGELVCGTSAVISVVVMGLYVNYYRAHISAEVFHFLHEFYEMVAHILNTVIFAIAGAKLGMLLMDGSTYEIFQIYSWRIFLIYPIVLFTRGLAILVAYPLLKRMGTGATWRDAVIMWWGGLRGSVGLALALVIQHTIYDQQMWGFGEHFIKDPHQGEEVKSLDCRDQPLVVVAMTLIVVMFTVVINGVTMAPLMRLLKMTDVTASRKVMINGSYAKLEKETDHCLGSLKGEQTFFHGVDWESVKDMNFSDYDNPAIDCVPKAAWMSALSIERASYLRQFEWGLLSTDGFAALERFMATLLADADKIDPSRELSQRDRVDKGIDEKEKGALTQRYHSGILEVVKEHTRGTLNMKKLALDSQLREAEETCDEMAKLTLEREIAQVERRIGQGEENGMRLSDRVLAYHIAKAYMIGQMDVKKAMELYHKEQTKGGKAAAAAAVGVRASAKDMKATAEAIFHEMQAVVAQHSSMLDAMNALLHTADQPGSAHGRYTAWKSRYVAELLLLEQREVVEHLQHAGLLDALDAAPLIQQLDHRIGNIILAPVVELMKGLRSRLLAALHLGPTLAPTATATVELPTIAEQASTEEETSEDPTLSRLSSRAASVRGVVIPRGSIAMGSGDGGKGGLGLLQERDTSMGSIFGRKGFGTIANLLKGASPESSRMQEGSVSINDSPSKSRSDSRSKRRWGSIREQTEVGVAEPTPLIDVDATAGAIADASKARNESHDASYTLMHAGDTFGSEWFDALRAVGSDTAEVGSQLDMVMIGDFGRDQDDEKALAMAVAMRRLGLIGNLWVVANMGDSAMRARLAKGTVSALGAHDVRVAKGSRGGESAKQSKFAYEFDCPYLAEESELDELGGHELAFAAIAQAKSEDHKLAFVLCSACTDMAAIIRDPRWEATAPGVVSHVTAMGGADILADGSIQMSIDGSNNKFDPAAASFVYSTLNADRRFWLIVVTRFAAAACQLPRSSFDGSVHPMARRLSAVMAPSLQKLWERCHLTEMERMLKHDNLAMRVDPAWFRQTFLDADAPRGLGKGDTVWPWVRGFNEYDGLTMVIAATATHPELFTTFFQPYVCPNSSSIVVGRSEAERGIRDGKKVSEILHFLLATSMGPGSGEWFGRLVRTQTAEEKRTDMLMVGDFGNSPDGEKGLIMAVAMRRIGLVGELTVVANLGDARMRARLAKGTLNALGAHEILVGAGSDGGRANETLHDYEIDACPYLAPDEELDPRGGHELALAAIRDSRDNGRKITLVLFSALTDMAALLRDPRWDELAHDTVSHVVIMGGLIEAEDGALTLDKGATNNTYDLESAAMVYGSLIKDDGLGKNIQLIVVTRHAAGAVRLPKRALDGSSHPTALRLTMAEHLSLQKLWTRVHMTQAERKAGNDTLPMRCGPAWFRSRFLGEHAPKRLGPSDDVWPHVSGLIEYNSLSTLVAATATQPELFSRFFKPHQCSQSSTLMIGRSEKEVGITMSATDTGIAHKASELLHDLLVTAFHSSQQYRKGFKIEIRNSPLDGRWQLAMLDRPARGQGVAGWEATVYEGPDDPNSKTIRVPVYLTSATEGVLWRLAHQLGDTEPILPDLRLGVRYRLVKGLRAAPWYVTQGTWSHLRNGFRARPDDVWVTGYQCAGNALVQFLVRVLLHGGDAEAATAAPYACGVTSLLEADVAVGKVGLEYLDNLPPGSRVFTTHQMPPNLPCCAPPGWAQQGSMEQMLEKNGRLLPPDVRVIHVVRDPRDSCVSLFHQIIAGDEGCRQWDVWAHAYAEGSHMAWGGWLAQNTAWWQAHERHPEQVLWISFEEIKQDAEAAVRRVATFLKLEPTEEAVRATALAVDFEAMKRLLHTHTKLRAGRSSYLGGRQLSAFSRQMLRAFEKKIITPARACGMQFLAAELHGALSAHPQVARGPTLSVLEPDAHAAALAATDAKRPPEAAAPAAAAQPAGSGPASAGQPAVRVPSPVTGIDALSAAQRSTELTARSTAVNTSLSIDEKLAMAGRPRVEPNVGAPGALSAAEVGAPGALSAVEAEESVARAVRVAEVAGRQAPEAPEEASAASRV